MRCFWSRFSNYENELKCGKTEKHLRNTFGGVSARRFYTKINPKLFLPTCMMPTISRNDSRNDFRNDPRNDPRNVETTYSDYAAIILGCLLVFSGVKD
jgi:hypothetical protein